MKIAFQGEHGAYSEVAILEHFGEGHKTVPCETFDAVFFCVGVGDCESGMIPIENSLAGSIHRNYDLLLHNTLEVTGEHTLRIAHCLIGNPGATLEGVKRVISHPQALAQCEQYLRSLGVKTEPVYDTAGSVKIVQESRDTSTAAVASRQTAEMYGMSVLAKNIEDNPANYTRFLAISKRPAEPSKDAKTSIVFSLVNKPGALFRAMSVFALRDIDLTKIESRPLVGKPWDYFFYIDLVGSVNEEHVQNALQNLKEYATFLRVLGSYPRHHYQ